MNKIHSIVQILKSNDSALSENHAGMGFAISTHYIVTCTHVVCDALNYPRDKKPEYNDGPVYIHFSSVMDGNKKIFEATVDLSYGCFDSRDCRDFTILRLKEPIGKDFSPLPIIRFENNSLVYRKTCSYYYDEGRNAYGWGEGYIVDEVIGSRIQINQADKGSGRLISKGFSGSPVWVDRLGGIVGIIDQANSSDNRIATFIPMSVLIKHLPPNIEYKEIPDHLNNEKVPKLPVDYIRRNSVLTRLKSIIYSDKNCHQKQLIVLTGPSGCGKTSIALDIYHNHKTKASWIDCNKFTKDQTKESFLREVVESDLIIVDDVFLKHELFTQNWIEKINGKVLVTTASLDVGEMLLTKNNCNKKEFLFTISGLDETEAQDYIRDSISQGILSDKQIKFILDKTERLAILLKFFVEIINHHDVNSIRSKFDDLLPTETRSFFRKKISFPDISKEGMIKELVNRWIFVNEYKESLPKVMIILCKIPIVGMSYKVLRYVLDNEIPEQDLQKLLMYLINRGFVSMQDSKLSKNSNALLIPHSVIKDNLVSENQNSLASYYLKYLSLFEDLNNVSSDFSINTGEYLNLAMIKMKSLFDNFHVNGSNYDAFFKQFHELANQIEKNIPKDGTSFADSEWIANLFKKSIPNAECSVLISLGQMIKQLPAHVLLAESIWLGSENDDGWARACCIHAAATHWKKLNDKDVGAEKIKSWIMTHLIQQHNSEIEVDLDMSAALGALCNLGNHVEAIKIINSVEFNNYIKVSTSSDLTVIIFLIGIGKIDEAKNLVEKVFSRISQSAARTICEQFFIKKGINYNGTRSNVIVTHLSMSLSIAMASNNQEFFNHVRTADSESRSYIG
jgi:hypothetical protein